MNLEKVWAKLISTWKRLRLQFNLIRFTESWTLGFIPQYLNMVTLNITAIDWTETEVQWLNSLPNVARAREDYVVVPKPEKELVIFFNFNSDKKQLFWTLVKGSFLTFHPGVVISIRIGWIHHDHTIRLIRLQDTTGMDLIPYQTSVELTYC